MNFNNQARRLTSLWRLKLGLSKSGYSSNAFSKQHPRIANQLSSYFHKSSYNKFPEEGSDRYAGEGIISSIKRRSRWVWKEKPKMCVGACLLYEACSDSIDFLVFFKKLQLPDTFLSWFLLTELHVWMCMVRVVAEGHEGRFIRNQLVKAMWEDVTTRLSKLGNVPASLKKEVLEELNQHFQAALFSYDEGLLGNDKILAAALWRNFFCFKCEHPEHLETMVQYIRMQVANLDIQSRDIICFDGNPHWLPFKEIEAVQLQS